jgi:hypothetical protein
VAERRKAWDDPCVRSPQTLSEADRRIVAAWAADCAERVLGLFEAKAPADSRPRDAIARTRAFARGELGVAEEIRRRFENGGAAREVSAPAAAAAARAAGQATAIPHMGAHARAPPRMPPRQLVSLPRIGQTPSVRRFAGSLVTCPRRSERPCGSSHPSGRTDPALSGRGFSRRGF